MDSETLLHAQCGTPGYVAPEIVKNDPYGVQVDMWSLGVIAYILLCGFPPFYDDNNQALFKSIKRGQYEYPSPFWDDVSDIARDLIDKLLVLDPEKRYTAQQVLDHPFLKDESNASAKHLTHFSKCMKSYNARRKFRAGIMSLQAISAMKGFSAPKKPAAGAAGLMGKLAAGAAAQKAETAKDNEPEKETKEEAPAAEAPAPEATAE